MPKGAWKKAQIWSRIELPMKAITRIDFKARSTEKF
jgi:hypothetical protein